MIAAGTPREFRHATLYALRPWLSVTRWNVTVPAGMRDLLELGTGREIVELRCRFLNCS